MRFIATDLIHGFRTKHHNKVNNLYKDGMGLSTNTHFLIIQLPDRWILKLVARTMLLTLVVVALPSLGSILGELSSNSEADHHRGASFDSINLELMPVLFRDLANEGLLKIGDRAVFIGGDNNDEAAIYNSQIISGNEMDLISYSDSERQSSIPDETFDFAFTHGFRAVEEFIDRTLKVGGIVTVQLSEDPSLGFHKPSNYKIVYLRRFDSTIVAMRKTSYAAGTTSPRKRRLCGLTSEAKKAAALKKLEDVLLEPPRAASGKSKRYLKKTRYLPDLLGDSLESYPRRVFIDVGSPEKDGSSSGAGDAGWFAKHYPTRNKDFEMYKIETVPEESSSSLATKELSPSSPPQMEISDWLKRNVREEEYVVMKAEAEAAEEMVKSEVLGLVDELFLECKHRGLNGKSKSSRRAYWECLALYGRLRDEGVAVHQWWG